MILNESKSRASKYIEDVKQIVSEVLNDQNFFDPKNHAYIKTFTLNIENCPVPIYIINKYLYIKTYGNTTYGKSFSDKMKIAICFSPEKSRLIKTILHEIEHIIDLSIENTTTENFKTYEFEIFKIYKKLEYFRNGTPEHDCYYLIYHLWDQTEFNAFLNSYLFNPDEFYDQATEKIIKLEQIGPINAIWFRRPMIELYNLHNKNKKFDSENIKNFFIKKSKEKLSHFMKVARKRYETLYMETNGNIPEKQYNHIKNGHLFNYNKSKPMPKTKIYRQKNIDQQQIAESIRIIIKKYLK